MKKYIPLLILVVIVFLPTLVELLIYAQGELDILPVAKLLVHFAVPILFTTLLMGLTVRRALLDPFTWEKTTLKSALFTGTFVGLLAMTAIFGGHVIFSQLVDSTAIIGNLSDLGINKTLFPLVALWIIIINPLMEEYFWRGFVYHRGIQLVKSERAKKAVLVGSGVIFALHHTIIIEEWFNWWQFLASTIFLAVAGVVFNLMYKRSGSIIPSLIAHFMADLAIVVVGFQMFGFFTG